jgi:hypothetical protein
VSVTDFPDTAPESDARPLLDGPHRNQAPSRRANFGAVLLSRAEERRKLVGVDGLGEKELHDAIIEKLPEICDGATGNEDSMRLREFL